MLKDGARELLSQSKMHGAPYFLWPTAMRQLKLFQFFFFFVID